MNYTRIDPDGEGRPQLETMISNQYEGIIVRELGSSKADGTFIHCERPVEARP